MLARGMVCLKSRSEIGSQGGYRLPCLIPNSHREEQRVEAISNERHDCFVTAFLSMNPHGMLGTGTSFCPSCAAKRRRARCLVSRTFAS